MVLKYVIITEKDICSEQTTGIARQLLIIILVHFKKKKAALQQQKTQPTKYLNFVRPGEIFLSHFQGWGELVLYTIKYGNVTLKKKTMYFTIITQKYNNVIII